MNERLAFGFGTSGQAATPVPSVRLKAPLPSPATIPVVEARKIPERSEWAFTGLMLFTAMLYTRPQGVIPGLASVPLGDILAISALAGLAYNRSSRGLPLTRMTAELAGVLALGAIMLLTAPFSIWPGGAVATFIDPFMKVLLIFALMVNTLTTPKRLERFVWLMVLLTSYVAGRAVFDYARGFNLVENGRVQGAVGGMFQNPNDLALNMVAILPIAVMLAMRSRGAWRLAAGGAAFLMVGATVASQSRGGFLGLAIMLMFLAVQIARRSPGFIAAGVFAVLLALPLVPGTYWERVSSITDNSLDATGSRESRRNLLLDAWETFLQYPVTGVGAGNFKVHNPPGRQQIWQETHNVVLQFAAELGFVATAVFLFLLYRGLTAASASRRLLRRATAAFRKQRPTETRPPAPAVVTQEEADFLEVISPTMRTAIAGWFFCALFASVGYHWTFYYLLALAVTPREILLDRLSGRSLLSAAPSRRSAAGRGRA